MNPLCEAYAAASYCAGFVCGASLLYYVLVIVKKVLLTIPATSITPSDIRRWHDELEAAKELSLITRQALDKISNHG